MFNFKLSKLDPHENNKKLKEVFEKLKCAAKVNLVLGFISRNVDTDEYRHFCALENNTFFEKSHLLCSKGDIVSLRDRIEKMDLVETCSGAGENKMAICSDYKCNNILRSPKKYSNGMYRCCSS